MINILIGIICSFIAWWIVVHLITPKLRFSEVISKIKSRHVNGFDYRIKYENYGRRRIVDLEMNVYLNILGLSKYRKKTWEVVQLQLRDEGRLAYLEPVRKGGWRRFVVIDVNNTSKFDADIFPKEVINKFKLKELELEDLLRLGNESFVEILISGYDDYSGSRKVFRSKRFKLQDVKEGFFETKSLKILAKK
jgi:hypothetical protein